MLRHWFFLGIAVVHLAGAFSRSLWYLHFRITEALSLPRTVALSKIEKRRLRHYFFGTSYLSAIFCCLRGRDKTPDEQYLFSNLSALASFFDDLVEVERTKVGSLRELPGTPVLFAKLTDKRGLAFHLLQNVYQKLPSGNVAAFQAYMQRVFTVEMQSLNEQPLDGPVLESLTLEKGGCSVLLFRSLLEPLPTLGEETALFQVGSLIQLSDDIFDVWFDQNAGITTLATWNIGRGGVASMMMLFEQQLTATRQSFQAIPCSKWRVKVALQMIHALTAITRTCLLRYQELEKKNTELPLNSRKLMVVDMEKWTNRLLVARFMLFPG